MNRALDFLLSLALIAMTLPIWILVILFIVILSPGSPFFVHQRIGYKGQPFGLIKFRTMRPGGKSGPQVTVAGDSRITLIGRFLRALKLDELPQLLNILTGHMTFVGPRPEAPVYVKKYTPEQKQVLDYKPGLADPAILKYRHEEKILAQYDNPQDAYVKIILPDKIKISLDYQKNRNFLADLRIILKTVVAIFRR